MQCNPSFITSAKISLISFDHGVIVFVQELYRRKGDAQFVKGMESAHVKGSHPLVLHGAGAVRSR